MNQILREKKGFSLIEIAIVLVIIGLIMSAGVTIFRSSIQSTRLSTTKTNLDNIKTAVINFAMATGRLPCPNSTTPPNNTGQSNPATAGTCAGCANPPCYVPFQTLQINLPGGRDSFGNVFRYDIGYDTAGGTRGLTNTTQDTFCGVLFEYMSHATDTGAQTVVPCVTNTNDAADDGQIGAAGQGYAIAAIIISQTDTAGSIFNAPAGLNLKNVASTPREYEMAGRQNDSTYGNLGAELTYGDLYNKACNSQNTRLAVFAPVAGNFSVRIPSAGSCYSVTTAVPAYLTIGQAMDYYAGCTDCITSCSPSITYTYQQLSNFDWNPAIPVNPRDGRVNANNTDH
ncbi:MAG: type II secretion system protein [Syntrophales bacterium]